MPLCFKAKMKKGLVDKRGQMIIEYSLMFVVLVSVLIYASTAFVRPALNRFFNSTANVIDVSVNIVQSGIANGSFP